jgi:membrane-bound inhibitor of C-type lysozyme
MNRKYIATALLCLALAACAPAQQEDPRTEGRAVSATDSAQQPPVTFRCGNRVVAARFMGDDKLSLNVDGVGYALSRTVSADGARYETQKGAEPAILFWNKGDRALFEINGVQQPECVAKKPLR